MVGFSCDFDMNMSIFGPNGIKYEVVLEYDSLSDQKSSDGK